MRVWECSRRGWRGREGGENQPTIPGILYVRLDLRRAHDINSLFEAGIGASIASLPLASHLALCSGSLSSPFVPCQLVCHPLLVYISLFRVYPTRSFIVFTLPNFLLIDGLITCVLIPIAQFLSRDHFLASFETEYGRIPCIRTCPVKNGLYNCNLYNRNSLYSTRCYFSSA